jgi:hypothetical protein
MAMTDKEEVDDDLEECICRPPIMGCPECEKKGFSATHNKCASCHVQIDMDKTFCQRCWDKGWFLLPIGWCNDCNAKYFGCRCEYIVDRQFG